MFSFDPRLCLITDRSFCDEGLFYSHLEQALDAGVTWVQIREKSGWTDRQVWEWGLEVRARCRARNIPLVVNDRLDLAMALDADGVHLGQNDLPLPALRSLWKGDKLWGVSVTSVSEAERAATQGASYLGVGALFPTTSKSDALPVDVSILQALQTFDLPLIGIGGITPTRARTLKELGCAGVAVISAVWGAPDPGSAVREFRDLWTAVP